MGPSITEITDRLYRVEQQRRGLVANALGPYRLNLAQWIALCALARDGASTMTELAAASAMDRTALTRTIDTLMAKGLAARHTPPEDRRTVIVEATAEGLTLAARIRDEIEGLERQWLSGLGEAGQARLVADLETLLQGRVSGGDPPAGPGGRRWEGGRA